jgi:hypothetical protein
MRWHGLRLTDLLSCSVDEACTLFEQAEHTAAVARLFPK